MPDITLAEWARLQEVLPQAVTTQVNAGLPATESQGKGKPRYVNSRAAIDWLIARAVRKFEAPDDGETLVDAALRKARADADLAEMKVAEAANAVIPLDAVEAMFEQALVLVATQLDGIAGRIAATVAAESDAAVCRQVIFDECRRVRDAMAAQFEARAALEARSAGGEAAAAEDGGSVGGSVPDSAEG